MEPFRSDLAEVFDLDWPEVSDIVSMMACGKATLPETPLDFIPRDPARRAHAVRAWLEGHMKEEFISLLVSRLRPNITSLAWDADQGRLYAATANSIGVSLRIAFNISVAYSEYVAEQVRAGKVCFYGSVGISRVRQEGEKSEDLHRRRKDSVTRWLVRSGLEANVVQYLAESLRPEVTMLEWLFTNHDRIGTLYVEHDVRVAPPPPTP